jgi:hypothetical protein
VGTSRPHSADEQHKGREAAQGAGRSTETGVRLPTLMAKSRHTGLTSLVIYPQPTFDAIAAATAALDPARRH